LSDHLLYKLAVLRPQMANECAYASPTSGSPLSDGENKENRQEAGFNGARSSKMKLVSVCAGNVC